MGNKLLNYKIKINSILNEKMIYLKHVQKILQYSEILLKFYKLSIFILNIFNISSSK
jgi:hypothetical protein